MIPDRLTYLVDVVTELKKMWPENRIINMVCHGHSVPAGYFATPYINTFSSYPHILKEILCERFPFACINVIVTAIGGEDSISGCGRFEEVLCHRPDVVMIDYGLNDRRIDPQSLCKEAWTDMICASQNYGAKVILLTPGFDMTYYRRDEDEKTKWDLLMSLSEQIRFLAETHQTGLSDSFGAFERYIARGGELTDLLSGINHPNRLGHELIAIELSKWFAAG